MDPIVEEAIREEIEKPEGELTEAGLKEIAKLQQLTDLSLSNTPITNASLKEVAKLQNLTRLFLPYTKITDAGLREVAKCT